MGGHKTKGHMAYQPEDSLRKAELMAVELRKSKRRDLIATKRAHRSQQATKQQPACPTCGEKKEDPRFNVSQTELHV